MTGAFFLVLGVLIGLLAGIVLARRLQKDVTPSAAVDLGASQAELLTRITAMQERVDAYQARIAEFEKDRAVADATVKSQLDAVARAGVAMEQEARTLRQALATSTGVRGKWGEQVLANILERCGLNQGVDYDLQATVAGDAGLLRPDAIVHLTSGLDLAVDAKASLSDFLTGLECSDEAGRRVAFERFARVLRGRARELAGKDYASSLKHSAPFVVMFVPSEAALRAALDADSGLLQFGQGLNPAIVLASPSTLFPVLALIAQGWRQHRAAERMGEILREVSDFGKRLQTFLEHLQAVGKGIEAAGASYNKALASYRSRLAPKAEKLQELQAGWADEPALKPVENRPLLADAADTADSSR